MKSCFPTSMPCRARLLSSIQFSQDHLLKMLLSPAYRFGGILVKYKTHDTTWTHAWVLHFYFNCLVCTYLFWADTMFLLMWLYNISKELELYSFLHCSFCSGYFGLHWGLLWFHMDFRLLFSNSVNVVWILTVNALNLYIIFSKMIIFTI